MPTSSCCLRFIQETEANALLTKLRDIRRQMGMGRQVVSYEILRPQHLDVHQEYLYLQFYF
jgi:hypothetical protein